MFTSSISELMFGKGFLG